MVLANIFGPDLGIVAVVIIAILLFGSQAPKIARNMGLAGREFRKAQEEAERDAASKAAAAPPAVPQATADDKVTLSRSELDALLAEREARAKREASSS
ncbi:twin-arginine translocase TatA/TatE family subunit [Acidiferrimicrobium sp. IK]|uniref:twin-arginine translocase TatA/TatE family subunit n=1 Tax=Acidiferrimicrobium sp. IK TaxID=2871700 RepID=UPI0021CB0C54|nr:twin-arginine translocase TatA/TatE family subunit [Acidiferrimicrobium sp. IK]MCU4185084.1 twin-arginine translocase TatA/TatE family subunit [Acidiferrimicrobium sp. IK]